MSSDRKGKRNNILNSTTSRIGRNANRGSRVALRKKKKKSKTS